MKGPIVWIMAESMVHVDTTARDDPEQVWNDVMLVRMIRTNIGMVVEGMRKGFLLKEDLIGRSLCRNLFNLCRGSHLS